MWEKIEEILRRHRKAKKIYAELAALPQRYTVTLRVPKNPDPQEYAELAREIGVTCNELPDVHLYQIMIEDVAKTLLCKDSDILKSRIKCPNVYLRYVWLTINALRERGIEDQSLIRNNVELARLVTAI